MKILREEANYTIGDEPIQDPLSLPELMPVMVVVRISPACRCHEHHQAGKLAEPPNSRRFRHGRTCVWQKPTGLRHSAMACSRLP
ncbi:MAG: hypothetical protein QOJ99_1083 [Bryobacterales bacterium]|nr:hypothetical protein [Bryobacterales bacterium]